MQKLLTLTAAVAVALPGAAAAAAPAEYAGKTAQGQAVTASLKDGKLSRVAGAVHIVCYDPSPSVGVAPGFEAFAPRAASFAVGRPVTVKRTDESVRTGREHVITYRVEARKAGARKITGKLAISFTTTNWDYWNDYSVDVPCSGETTFTIRRR